MRALANEARQAFGTDPVVFRDAADPVADDGRRQIQILDGHVVVDRRVAGVRMRVRVDVAAYHGVALIVGQEGTSEPLVTLTLVHRDPALDVTLYRADHDRDVAAEWQHWAGQLGLPMLVPQPEGGFSQPFPQLGPLAIAEPQPRRRPSSLSARRPRFLSRRRVARLPETPRVHREREIIARN